MISVTKRLRASDEEGDERVDYAGPNVRTRRTAGRAGASARRMLGVEHARDACLDSGFGVALRAGLLCFARGSSRRDFVPRGAAACFSPARRLWLASRALRALRAHPLERLVRHRYYRFRVLRTNTGSVTAMSCAGKTSRWISAVVWPRITGSFATSSAQTLKSY